MVKGHFFRGAPAGKGDDFIKQFIPGIIHFFLLIHLHGVPQSPICMRNNRNFLHRRRMGLAGGYDSMPDLMVSNVFLFFFGDQHIFALVACNNDIDRLLQVFAGHLTAPITHRAKRRFIDDIGQFRTAGAGGRAGNLFQIHVIAHLHIFGMYLQNGITSIQIRQFHRDPTVKTTRPQKRLIQRFRPIGRR